jgi:hypothetical protein
MPGAWILAGALLITTAGAAQAATPASISKITAGPKPVKKVAHYNVAWTFKSRILHRCITIRASGTIHYTRQGLPNPRTPPPEVKFYNIKLTNPLLTATVSRHPKGSSTCTGKVTLSRISIGQHWTGFACNFNPSLTVSIPWGVSFSAWPNCGDRNQASYTTNYGKSSVYTQGNSGSPTKFGDITIFEDSHAPCYGVTASTVGHVGTHTSDSYGASNGSQSREVCLSKK